MAGWLSAEWAEGVSGLAALLPPVDGLTGTVSLAVTGPAKREVRARWRYEGGVAGPDSSGGSEVADLELLMAGPDAVEVLLGRVEPSVAFMRGRLKASGDNALLLGFLESTTRSGYGSWREQVAGLALETSG